MGKHNFGRLVAILISVAVFAISLVFNGLSVVGAGELNDILSLLLLLEDVNSPCGIIKSNIMQVSIEYKSVVFPLLQVLIQQPQAMCRQCMTLRSPLQAGPSTSGLSSISGWWQ
ncbi:hypothetical protein GOODEAATRI_022413 [Goodea atripinnis]|uniref:Uncharacterized protein n=1 Tax=Goodea atripinnis TaxID=208336 RepID=A0ABV0PQT1_9TELE